MYRLFAGDVAGFKWHQIVQPYIDGTYIGAFTAKIVTNFLLMFVCFSHYVQLSCIYIGGTSDSSSSRGAALLLCKLPLKRLFCQLNAPLLGRNHFLRESLFAQPILRLEPEQRCNYSCMV